MEWASPGEPTPEDLLAPLAVATTTLETLDHFGADESLKGEMAQLLSEARAEMVAILNAVLEQLTSASDPYPQASPREWRRVLVSLTGDTPGAAFEQRRLPAPKRQPYRFDLVPTHVVSSLGSWGHRQVIANFHAALRKALQSDVNYSDSTMFAIAVRDHALALVLAWLSARDAPTD